MTCVEKGAMNYMVKKTYIKTEDMTSLQRAKTRLQTLKELEAKKSLRPNCISDQTDLLKLKKEITVLEYNMTRLEQQAPFEKILKETCEKMDSYILPNSKNSRFCQNSTSYCSVILEVKKIKDLKTFKKWCEVISDRDVMTLTQKLYVENKQSKNLPVHPMVQLIRDYSKGGDNFQAKDKSEDLIQKVLSKKEEKTR